MPRHADADLERHAALGRAQALIRAGRPAEAIPLLERTTAGSPAEPAGWVALGVARSLAGDHDRAIEAASRAAALAPRVAAVHLARGDILRMAGEIAGARGAYATAVELAPDDADALNKLAGSERMSREFDAAQRHLARALAVAPSHPYARVNLATLAVERHDVAGARALLADVMRQPGLPADAAAEASTTLAMLDEQVAMQPVLDASVAQRSHVAVDEALRARSGPVPRDDMVVALFDEIAARAARERPIDAGFGQGGPWSGAWPAIEAHHNFRDRGGDDAIAATVALVAQRSQDIAPAVIDYADAVAERTRGHVALDDAIAWDAWLRFLHARLNRSDAAVWPGHPKPVNNRLTDSPRIPRTPPIEVAGTVRAVMSRIDAALPPGAWRGAVQYLAVIQIHPFADGNGRVARFVLNRALAEAGLHPSVRPGNDDESLTRLVNLSRETRDARPVAEWLARASRDAAELDRTWMGRSP